MEIDWVELRVAATEAMRRAYAPYSKFPVGAAGLVDDGRTVVGCNVENASYGLTLCAECGLVSALHATGGGRLVAVACVDAAGDALMPCGRCRQLLWENGGPECLVDAFPEPRRMADLLPHAFDVTDLDAVGSTPHAPVVPARLAHWRGRGTAFVHPDMAGGQRVWTGYWERSRGLTDAGDAAGLAEAADVAGTAVVDDVEEEPGILEEAPTFADAADAVAWGRARTPRVVVVDADGGTYWAGDGQPPTEIELRWPS
ncbi:MAG TPA: cytidine deaminase [Micromonosporaceae bacterium]